MNGLALCAGYGGLELGLKLAIPQYRSICYVEREAYAASVLVARMEDSSLDKAPLWDDVATFDGTPWRGLVHIITAGYPCQPFSGAGKRLGDKDPRHIWPDIARIIEEVQPEWVFLENVANHLRIGFREVRGRLQDMGYSVEAGLFTASEFGAPHERARLFILAHSISNRWGGRDLRFDDRQGWESKVETERYSIELVNAPITGLEGGKWSQYQGARIGFSDADKDVEYPDIKGLEGRRSDRRNGHELSTWPPSPTSLDWGDIPEQYWPSEKTPERNFRGMANGTSVRVDRLRLCGNGVIPVVGAMAWIYLRRRFVTK